MMISILSLESIFKYSKYNWNYFKQLSHWYHVGLLLLFKKNKKVDILKQSGEPMQNMIKVQLCKGHSMIHLFMPPLYTKLIEICMGPFRYRMIMSVPKDSCKLFPYRSFVEFLISFCWQNEVMPPYPMDQWNTRFGP